MLVIYELRTRDRPPNRTNNVRHPSDRRVRRVNWSDEHSSASLKMLPPVNAAARNAATRSAAFSGSNAAGSLTNNVRHRRLARVWPMDWTGEQCYESGHPSATLGSAGPLVLNGSRR